MRLASGAKFAVLSFLCVMVFALSMGFALSSLLTRAVQEWEWENTAALTRREIELRGLDTVLAAPRSAPLDERTREQQLSSLMRGLPEVVRVKVWDRDATVVWSDEPRLIGQRFADDNELKEALAGEVTVEIKTLDGREHAYERPRFTTLAEVHVPIVSKTTGRVLGVVEVYKNPIVNSGAAALNRLLATSYDLVFSDMKMPGMNGIELYEEVARRRPGVERRMIFVTGDNLNPTTRQFLEQTGAVSVSKPFDIDAIRRLVPLHAPSSSEDESEVALRS